MAGHAAAIAPPSSERSALQRPVLAGPEKCIGLTQAGVHGAGQLLLLPAEPGDVLGGTRTGPGRNPMPRQTANTTSE